MNDTLEISPEIREPRQRTRPVVFLTRLVKEQPLGLIGGIIVLLFLFTGIFADWLAPYGVNDIHPRDYLHPPSFKYFLGADNLGRDIYSRIVFGARISMIVGLGATTLAILVALLIGVPSGFFGGKFDMVVQRFVDGWICFPPFIIFLFAVSIVGPGIWQLIIAMGLVQGIGVSRIMRSAVIAIRENMYVEAAAAIGSPTTKIITRHILPNIMPTIIILFSATVPGMILGEAGLSFLGLGIPPPDPTWGGMLSGSGRSYMFLSPLMSIWPGLALMIVVYGLNIFGDALRDLLDPRLRGAAGRYGGSRQKRAS